MLNIVFHEPEIPPNTGNAMRLAAVTGSRLHLIRPLGFEMDDARLRRAGMDYRDRATVEVHDDVASWLGSKAPGRVIAFTVDAETRYDRITYVAGDSLLFGRESVGLSQEIKSAAWVDVTARIPMVPDVRSINVANAAAIVVYEAWRQLDFAGSS